MIKRNQQLLQCMSVAIVTKTKSTIAHYANWINSICSTWIAGSTFKIESQQLLIWFDYMFERWSRFITFFILFSFYFSSWCLITKEKLLNNVQAKTSMVLSHCIVDIWLNAFGRRLLFWDILFLVDCSSFAWNINEMKVCNKVENDICNMCTRDCNSRAAARCFAHMMRIKVISIAFVLAHRVKLSRCAQSDMRQICVWVFFHNPWNTHTNTHARIHSHKHTHTHTRAPTKYASNKSEKCEHRIISNVMRVFVWMCVCVCICI